MNLLQLTRKTRFEVDAIRTGDIVSDLWRDEEIYSAINTAVDRAYRILRLNSSEIVTKSMNSTDGAVDFVSEIYDPTSLAITAGTADYELPPDMVSVVQITPITTGYDGIKFRPLRTTQRLYVDQRTMPTEDVTPVGDTEAVFFYVIFGERTLRIVPTPADSFDIEVIYNYQPATLQAYEAGTVSTGGAPSTTVTGTGTTWVGTGLRAPCELVVGDPDTTIVDMNAWYPAVQSFTSDTVLVLKKAQTIAALTEYQLAMVPAIPRQYHNWLAQRAAADLFRKVNIETATAAAKALDEQLAAEIQPETAMRQMQESIPVEPFQLPE